MEANPPMKGEAHLLFEQHVPKLAKLCAIKFAELVGENHLVIDRIFPSLPSQVTMLILEVLSSDALFYYYVVCSGMQFEIYPWKKYFKKKYVEEMNKTIKKNIELVDQIGSWKTKHALPLLPKALNGFYEDMEDTGVAAHHFKKYFLELKKMVNLMRETRKLNGKNNLNKNEAGSQDGNILSDNGASRKKHGTTAISTTQDVRGNSFSQSDRGLVHMTKKIVKRKPTVAKKNKKKNTNVSTPLSSVSKNKNKGKKKKSASPSTIIKFNSDFLLVPSCFGCDSLNVSLNFFFPHTSILNSINSWGKNIQRPPYMHSLRDLSLRGATLTDDLIEKVCKQHPFIESLDLTSKKTVNVSSKSLNNISTLIKLTKLSLGLWKEPIFDLNNIKRFVALFSEECRRALDPRKKSAAKSQMREIRENIIIYAPPLKYLSVEQTLIKDDALNFLLREFPRLLDVNLNGCMYLTNKCLFGFSNPDLRIERLNHCGCYKLTNEGFSRPLLSVHPDILFYNDSNLFAINYDEGEF